MTDDEPREILRAVWRAEGQRLEVEEETGPQHQKACKNMKDVTFDGFAPPGSDLGSAWRAQLAREGKLSKGSLADLVLDDDR